MYRGVLFARELARTSPRPGRKIEEVNFIADQFPRLVSCIRLSISIASPPRFSLSLWHTALQLLAPSAVSSCRGYASRGKA